MKMKLPLSLVLCLLISFTVNAQHYFEVGTTPNVETHDNPEVESIVMKGSVGKSIFLHQGETYFFHINTPGQQFHIGYPGSLETAACENTIVDGVEGNATDKGIMAFTPGESAGFHLQYTTCNGAGTVGDIYILAACDPDENKGSGAASAVSEQPPVTKYAMCHQKLSGEFHTHCVIEKCLGVLLEKPEWNIGPCDPEFAIEEPTLSPQHVPTGMEMKAIQHANQKTNPKVWFRVEETQTAHLTVYDLSGKEVAVIFDGAAVEGKSYVVSIPAEKVTSHGCYYKLTTEAGVLSGRVMLM